MIISYWDCKFNNYEEHWAGENETRVYGCSHPDNEDRYCTPDNKWCDDKAECPLAELEGPSRAAIAGIKKDQYDRNQHS